MLFLSMQKDFSSDDGVAGDVVRLRGGLSAEIFDGVEPEAVQRELKGPDSECSQSGGPDDGACGPISSLGEL